MDHFRDPTVLTLAYTHTYTNTHAHRLTHARTHTYMYMYLLVSPVGMVTWSASARHSCTVTRNLRRGSKTSSAVGSLKFSASHTKKLEERKFPTSSSLTKMPNKHPFLPARHAAWQAIRRHSTQLFHIILKYLTKVWANRTHCHAHLNA